MEKRIAEDFDLKPAKASALLQHNTGVAHFYNAFRPSLACFVRRRSAQVTQAFGTASSAQNTERKIAKIFHLLFEPDYITARFKNGDKKRFLRVSALSPVLACLDPDLHFPIMTAKTRPLLKDLQQTFNIDGAIALSSQIGIQGKDSLDLDVYAVKRFNNSNVALQKET